MVYLKLVLRFNLAFLLSLHYFRRVECYTVFAVTVIRPLNNIEYLRLTKTERNTKINVVP